MVEEDRVEELVGAGAPEDQVADLHVEAGQAMDNHLLEEAEHAMAGEEAGRVGEHLGEARPILPLPVEAHWATQQVRRTARRRRILSISAAELAEERKQGLRSAKKVRRVEVVRGRGIEAVKAANAISTLS